MSWSTWAAKVFGAKPVYLYKLEKDSDVAFYASRVSDISALPATMELNFFDPADFFAPVDFFAATFKGKPITHTAITITSTEAKKLVTLTLPRLDTFAQKFVGPLGIATTRITIWHGFENDPDGEFVRLFLGEILLVKPSMVTTSLVCEDFSSAMKNKGIADVIQRPCRHALYYGKCQLTIADWQDTGSATAMTNSTVTVTEASAQPDGHYAGGIITYGGALQLITAHSGASLTVLGSVGALEADIAASGPQPVTLARGCNRSMADCDTVFGNDDNFGGFEHLTDSPFDGRSIT